MPLKYCPRIKPQGLLSQSLHISRSQPLSVSLSLFQPLSVSLSLSQSLLPRRQAHLAHLKALFIAESVLLGSHPCDIL